jgi:protein-L-isoaspartate(D-aspartate) O-methyltransferase
MSTIQEHRTFYANFIVKSVGSSNEKLIAAFAATKRERYLGGGPWPILVNSSYISTLSDDPRLLYQDVLVGLATERGINNGQPSLHARCLTACSPVAGESAIHIGAGTGYYTAILAALIGSTGHVSAYEIEADLAAKARKHLRHLPNVEVFAASASEGELPRADIIYVNAGVTHPPHAWLDSLNIGGRLIFPLTQSESYGVMLLVTRRGADSFAASAILPVGFIPCIGARDETASAAITAAIHTRSIFATQSLRRGTEADATATLTGKNWWLSSAEPA